MSTYDILTIILNAFSDNELSKLAPSPIISIKSYSDFINNLLGLDISSLPLDELHHAIQSKLLEIDESSDDNLIIQHAYLYLFLELKYKIKLPKSSGMTILQSCSSSKAMCEVSRALIRIDHLQKDIFETYSLLTTSHIEPLLINNVEFYLNIDQRDWDSWLSLSTHSVYAHSVDYHQFVKINTNRLLIKFNNEYYLFCYEVQNGTILSFSKYYAGLIPIVGFENIDKVLNALLTYLKKQGKQVLFSHLTSNNTGYISSLEKLLSELPQSRLYNIGNGWDWASILDVNIEHQKLWTNVYSTKTRNMIRKAEKNGVECRLIDPFEHLTDIIECTLSRPVRHGSRLPEYYYHEEQYKEILERTSKIHCDRFVSFGAFLKNKLIAYINTFDMHNECIANNMLSNANYLDKAPNNILFDYIAKYYCIKKTKHIMYSFETVNSVDRFKHSMGYRAVKVNRWLVELW